MEIQTHIYQGLTWEQVDRYETEAIARVQQNPLKPELIVFEPQPTYTGGFRAGSEDLVTPQTEGSDSNFVRVRRGGQWTYHGPGQVVIYPIFSLQAFGFSSRAVRSFLHEFREGVAEPLERWTESELERGCHPFGLYSVHREKLASFGISLNRGVTGGGVAVYFQDQSAAFARIHACGIKNQVFTSLWAKGYRGSWSETAVQLSDALKKRFLPRAKSSII